MNSKKKEILWFIILRLIIITSLLISALSLQTRVSDYFDLDIYHLYYLVGAVYLLSILYFVFYAIGKYFAFQAYLQILFDLVIITILVYFSGGLRGSFYFLYIFEIIAASIVLSSRATYVIAALSSVFFGILVDGMYLGLIPYYDQTHPSEYSFAFVINHMLVAWGVFFLVAFLINRLTDSLRKTQEQLEIARKELGVKKNLAIAGEFSAQLAHEIRNPLAAISGSVQVLRNELELSGEQKSLMNIIVDESQRVSQSIEQFLNLASPGSQTFSSINLSGILNEAVTLLSRSGVLNEKYQVLGNYRSIQTYYYGNPNQFKQIFWNLLKNGIKAMPDGGIFTIDFYRKNKGELRLMFSDTGFGMSEEEQKRLFEPFFSGFSDGKGIGMAIVHRIVDDYSGRVEVKSSPGNGTSISIILPDKEGSGIQNLFARDETWTKSSL